MTDQHDDYLWDRSGAPDPEVARLEALLAPLAHDGRHGRPTMPRTPSRRWVPLAAAAAVLLAAGLAWVVWPQFGWQVQRLAGVPVIEGAAVASQARLRTGEWLITDAAAVARIAVGRIGQVVVDPNSRVQLMQSGGREHRLALERGTIHARIWAPPRFFFVNTPSAVAVDLGCAYSLTVDAQGSGFLRVTQGWVALEHEGRTSFIPAGAMSVTRPGAAPGTPRYDDAPSGYGPALDILDFGGLNHPSRGDAFARVVAEARRRDALTLWHLLARGTAAERADVFDALSRLAPPPRGVTREAVLAGSQPALDQWWDSLGISTGAWWKLWKKK